MNRDEKNEIIRHINNLQIVITSIENDVKRLVSYVREELANISNLISPIKIPDVD